MALLKHLHSLFLRRQCFDSFHLSRFYLANNQIFPPGQGPYPIIVFSLDTTRSVTGASVPGIAFVFSNSLLIQRAFGALITALALTTLVNTFPHLSRPILTLSQIHGQHCNILLPLYSSTCKRQVPSANTVSPCLIQYASSSYS